MQRSSQVSTIDADNRIKKTASYAQLYTATDANTIGFESDSITERTETYGSNKNFLPKTNTRTPELPQLERQNSPTFPNH